MKQIFLVVFLSFFSWGSVALTPRTQLRKAINLIEKGNFHLGSRELYRLSRLRAFSHKRSQIKYTLGISFVEMGLYHLASLQFIYVIKRDKGVYRRKALSKLTDIVEYLGDNNLFYYIVSQIQEKDFPVAQKDKLYFYFGVVYFNRDQYKKSRYYFAKIKRGSSFYSRSLYYRALSYAEQNKITKSARLFRDLSYRYTDVTNPNRVAGLMGLARVLYQGNKFNESIKVYRSIPRDSKHFHDVLLENSWNFLRSGKFRSALSNFQSLHSSFYTNFYQPESLILRAYVYLYICRYYEMEKVLDLFNATYLPSLKKVKQSLGFGNLYTSYFNSIIEAKKLKEKGTLHKFSSALHPIVLHKVMKNTQFKSYLDYLEKLQKEQKIVQSLPASWRRDRVGRNASYILKSRIATTEKIAGKLVKSIFLEVKKDLERLSTSEQYLRYDMLRGKREKLKKKIARKYIDHLQIDEKVSRSYYVQNGYEYWPFNGEAWLDEIGNYHYLGQHNCE